MSPCDELDHASVVLPLRPRKGTVLLGFSTTINAITSNSNSIPIEAEETIAGVSWCGRDFKALVALFDSTTTSISENAPVPWSGHQVMVHCGGVRQAADVLNIEYFGNNNIDDDDDEKSTDLSIVESEWARTVAGANAAAAVLHHSIMGNTGNSQKSSISQDDIASSSCSAVKVKTARVRFKFSHRPEFMLPGSRVIFRDRSSGKVVGAGVILSLGEKEIVI